MKTTILEPDRSVNEWEIKGSRYKIDFNKIYKFSCGDWYEASNYECASLIMMLQRNLDGYINRGSGI